VSPAELDAVLEHEHYHVRNRDPLKLVLARALPAAFFYLPVLASSYPRKGEENPLLDRFRTGRNYREHAVQPLTD